MENNAMTQNAPEQPTPAAPAPSATNPVNPAAPVPPPTPGKEPPWGAKPEDFNPDKAWEMIQNLRVEKSDPAFRQEFQQFQAEQQKQRDALAKVFGVKPDEVSDTDKLAQQVGSLQQQILASERRALAAEHKVPESLLTGPDAESMKAQAEALVEFAKGAHVAATTAPAFQPNPGQGQGGGPLSPEAQAAAEYEKFYPSAPKK